MEIAAIEKRYHIILASASPRRSSLLSQIGLTFEVRVSDAEEALSGEAPEQAVITLAKQKARRVEERYLSDAAGAKDRPADGREYLIIAADTVVSAGGEILGKPKDETDALRMLSLLQGSRHQVYTGVALFSPRGSRVFCERTDVEIAPMTQAQIREYIASGEPLDKAGAYGIQGSFAAYVRRIEGDYYNVVGLPLSRLVYEIGALAKGSGIRLVATDIDGTLVKESSPEVYPEILRAFRELTDRGVLCCVASGRQYYSIRAMFSEVADDIVYIAENGAHIVYKGQDLAVTKMRPEQAHEIIRQMRTYGEGYEFVVSTPQGSLLESRDESFIRLIRDGYRNRMEVVDDVLQNDPVIIKCAMRHAGSVRDVAQRELIPAWRDRVKVCMAGEEWIDFMDAAVDKGHAIRFIQEYFGVGYEETMTFGDNENDIGMMEAAGMSYAVENACGSVKEAAGHICPGYPQKGVYQVLSELLSQKSGWVQPSLPAQKKKTGGTGNAGI